MDGKTVPSFPSHKMHARRLTAAIGLLVMTGTASAQTVIFGKEYIGFSPKEFEYGVAGEGGPGRWEVVRDHTAYRGKALTQMTIDAAAYRFLVAIYNPVVAANVQ